MLKQKQELKKQEEELKEEELKAEELKAEELKAEELKAEQLKAEQLKAEELKAEQLKVEVNKQNFSNLEDDTEVKLGDFDDDFTWSAMVLAAQGKKVNEISIDEIDLSLIHISEPTRPY